jgi:hypothetical protein
VAVAAGLFVYALGLERLPFTVCTFKAFTGWPCATCGTTRAAARLVRGDLAGALALNPATTLAGLGLVPWALCDLALLRRGRALVVSVAPVLRRALTVLLAAALLANWAYLVAAGR